jgi:hypothetical protein
MTKRLQRKNPQFCNGDEGLDEGLNEGGEEPSRPQSMQGPVSAVKIDLTSRSQLFVNYQFRCLLHWKGSLSSVYAHGLVRHLCPS